MAGPGINLTIEMETGTGKTYTYVKTMYELNRRYGWSKFIIVVPSVAIREGVAKSLETTQQHFSDEYGKKIRFFTYSSDKLTEVDNFASDSGIYRINHKSFYTVQFDTPELIDHSIRALDSKLNVTRVQINLEYGEQTARLESREQLEQGKGFQKARSDRESAKYAPLGSVRYDLVGKLVEETGLTRATVAAILRGIAPQTFSQFRINPEEFILKAARLINDEKATQIIEHITYNRLDAAYDQDVFTRATLRGKLDVNAMEANRSLYSHVIYDSDNERRFAQELDVSDQVAVYVKLPGSFYISTPVGKYNPDWAIAFNEGSVKHIYFVAETKGNLDTMELRGVENAKIECAKKHFAAISNGSVVYSVVDNYSTLMQLVSN